MVLRTVKDKEDNFYTKLGVTDYNQLNQKIQEIERKYNDLLPGGAIIREIKNRFSFVKISGASDEEIADAVAEVVDDYLIDEA
jgi:hypothetical protein